MGERVLEGIGQLGEDPLLLDELERLEPSQHLFGDVPEVGDTVQELARELAADDGGELQGRLRGSLQAVDARHQEVLDDVRHGNLAEVSVQDVTVRHPTDLSPLA